MVNRSLQKGGNPVKCIINGKVLLRDRMAEGLAILFEEKIEKLVPVKDLNLSDYEVIDAGGKYVSPGLVDMHTSVPMYPTARLPVLKPWQRASSKTV